MHSLEQAPNWLAIEFDKPVVELLAVPIEALGDLFEIPRHSGHLILEQGAPGYLIENLKM